VSSVEVVHAVVRHSALISCAEAVRSKTPRLKPTRVTEVPPELAAFAVDAVTTGPSKEKTDVAPVPTTPTTVSAVVRSSGETEAAAGTHVMLVGVTQTLDWHAAAPSLAEGVALSDNEPKLAPPSVKTPPPLMGTFRTGSSDVMAGESNVKSCVPVPTTPETVTVLAYTCPPLPAELRHPRLVAADHEVVAHTLPIRAVAVGSKALPKLSPTRVSDQPPDVGPLLRETMVRTGGS
jgi:hypothetical protein